jgi:hypothetical protein
LIHFVAGWTKMPVVVEMANRTVMVKKDSSRVSNRVSKANEDSKVGKVSRDKGVNKDVRVSRDKRVNRVSRVTDREDHNKVNSRVGSKAAHKAVAHKVVRDNMVAQRGVRKEMPGATIDSSVPNGANDFAKLKIYGVNGVAVRRPVRCDNWMK